MKEIRADLVDNDIKIDHTMIADDIIELVNDQLKGYGLEFVYIETESEFMYFRLIKE